MYRFEKKNSKIFSLEKPRENVWRPREQTWTWFGSIHGMGWVGFDVIILFLYISQKSQIEVDDHALSAKTGSRSHSQVDCH